MELIRISDSKLKVMLDAQDMTRYAISPDAMNYDNTETRRAIWQILDEAKQETGFDAAAGRLVIQVYPSREGGCELYITKIQHTAPRDGTRGGNNGEREVLYRFSDMNTLLAACRQLALRGYGRDSAAYAGEGGEYFLLLRAVDSPAAYLAPGLHDLSYLCEYGRAVTDGLRVAYIREHGKCLLPQDAVERLSLLA